MPSTNVSFIESSLRGNDVHLKHYEEGEEDGEGSEHELIIYYYADPE